MSGSGYAEPTISRSETWGIEIKSAERVDEVTIAKVKRLMDDLRLKRSIIASRESRPRISNGIEILPWRHALRDLFGQSAA